MKARILLLSAILMFPLFCGKASAQTDMSAYAPKLKNGTKAPAIVLPSLDGKSVSLSDFKGSYVVVDFWASWCGDCRREAPIMKKALAKYPNVKVLAVSFDRKREDLEMYLASNPMSYTVVSDFSEWKKSDITKAYELNWIPTFYIVSPKGKIVGSGITGEALESELQRILGK